MPKKPFIIEKQRLIIAEGADAYYFLIWAYQAYNRSDIQVFDFGGVGSHDLRHFLAAIRNMEHFDSVQTLLIARDAETDAAAAIDSARYHLEQAGFAKPDAPFSFTNSDVRTGIVLFPGFDDIDGIRHYRNGALEDLCLATVTNDPLMQCVDDYMTCAVEQGPALRHPHKSRLHAYLSCKSEHAGKKLSEAARDGAFDWNHPALAPLKEMILKM
ncbi:MAG: DUF3226 domain-containing protein [Capsulimonadaceae bacterium]